MSRKLSIRALLLYKGTIATKEIFIYIWIAGKYYNSQVLVGNLIKSHSESLKVSTFPSLSFVKASTVASTVIFLPNGPISFFYWVSGIWLGFFFFSCFGRVVPDTNVVERFRRDMPRVRSRRVCETTKVFILLERQIVRWHSELNMPLAQHLFHIYCGFMTSAQKPNTNFQDNYSDSVSHFHGFRDGTD